MAKGHKVKPEEDRGRVVCLECTWFEYHTGATVEQLREHGRRHTSATRPR